MGCYLKIWIIWYLYDTDPTTKSRHFVIWHRYSGTTYHMTYGYQINLWYKAEFGKTENALWAETGSTSGFDWESLIEHPPCITDYLDTHISCVMGNFEILRGPSISVPNNNFMIFVSVSYYNH